MLIESRSRINQLRGCLEAEIILPDGKMQYFKPNAIHEKEAIQEIALFIEGVQEAKRRLMLSYGALSGNKVFSRVQRS